MQCMYINITYRRVLLKMDANSVRNM